MKRWLCLGVLTVITLSGGGCTSTVVPRPIEKSAPSFSGAQANSGLVGTNGPGWFVITPAARDRYNGLVKLYGRYYVPPLKRDAGLVTTGALYQIDGEHLSKFIQMGYWFSEGKPPK